MTMNSLPDTPTDHSATWQEKALRLRHLHEGPDVLVLPNPWDRLSARLLASLSGCAALASTSAGIAAALGYPDGQRVPLDEMLAVVGQIVAAVDLPVTVDFEGGYADSPAQLAENVRRVVAVGGVGINLEDGIGDGMVGELRDPADQAERLDAAREALQVDGVPGVLNARTDVLMQQHGPPESWLPEAIRRCQLYAAHGADCVYVPLLPMRGQSPEEARRDIALLVREAGCPVNLLASPLTPPVSVLRELGVRRLSTGSGLFRLAYATAQEAAARLLAAGESGVLAPANGLPHPEVNRVLGASPSPSPSPTRRGEPT
jgi:2-methylisocitrate lyase-like PEP mutase family enzyme